MLMRRVPYGNYATVWGGSEAGRCTASERGYNARSGKWLSSRIGRVVMSSAPWLVGILIGALCVFAGCGQTSVERQPAQPQAQRAESTPPQIEPQFQAERPLAQQEQQAEREPAPQAVPATDKIAEAQSEAEREEEERWRTWTSADGNHTTVAKFIKLAIGIVTLEKEDETIIEVPKEKLSEADLKWLSAFASRRSTITAAKSSVVSKVNLPASPVVRIREQADSDGRSFFGSPFGTSSGKTVHVKGYTRKDGTYVQPHTRSAPHRK